MARETTDKVFRPDPPLNEEDQALIEAYQRVGVPADQLPYSHEFEELFNLVRHRLTFKTEDELAQKGDVYHRLLQLRKAARLPRLFTAASPPTETAF